MAKMINQTRLGMGTRLSCTMLALLAGAAASQGQTIAQGPVVSGGHLYFRLSNSNWTAAQAASVALGGHLVTINDAAENTFVLSTFANAPGSGRVWLGL